MYTNNPRLLLSASQSGGGKTTITCALLSALKKEHIKASAFKCGPDYIDPMFHEKVLSTPSTNLDIFLTGEQNVLSLLQKNSKDAQLAVIEGVMGYYDGLGGTTTQASAYHVAKITRTPVILVVDCKKKSISTLAEIYGFMNFKQDSNIKGIILNRTNKVMADKLTPIIEKEFSIPVIGFMPFLKNCEIPSRHLGLVTAEEIHNINAIMDRLGEAFLENISMKDLYAIAQSAPPIHCNEYSISPNPMFSSLRIGIAHDQAFSFYYKDSIRLLHELGAQIIEFSPLNDTHLPEGLDGIYIGGGYPELYIQQLAEETPLKKELRHKISEGIPTIAECGGYMYLHETIRYGEEAGAMLGVVPGQAYKTDHLQQFGYQTLTATKNTMLLKKGESIPVHEFHYFKSSSTDFSCEERKYHSAKTIQTTFAHGNIFAGFHHLHLYANPNMAIRFLNNALAFRFREKETL